jgi:hypothetical protein
MSSIQRVNVKFLVKVWKTASKNYTILKEVYRNECILRTQVFEWLKIFKGRETTEGDPRSRRPSKSKTNENI